MNPLPQSNEPPIVEIPLQERNTEPIPDHSRPAAQVIAEQVPSAEERFAPRFIP